MQGAASGPPSKGKKGKKGSDAAPAGASSVSSGVKLENVSTATLFLRTSNAPTPVTSYYHSVLTLHACAIWLPYRTLIVHQAV